MAGQMIVEAPERRPEPDRIAARFPHLPALDGLRGVAVALVVAYHLAPRAVPGGFLGVDLFFVLSGFLITSLIVDEVRARGSIALGAFYVRRLRRLAPALLLLVAALSAYAAWFATAGEVGRLRQHALWTIGYLANWRFIIDGTTYTDLVAGQSPLRHAWSLAIEEQFYVVFPLVALGLVRAARGDAERLRRLLLGLAVVGSLASAGWMAWLWQDGADPSRGYFGTDTRAHSLLVGVALGAIVVGRPPAEGRGAALARRVAGPAIVVLVVAVLTARESAGWLQLGGFLLVAVAAAAVIAALGQPGWLQRTLTLPPLVRLGAISYGVYLWHWPVIVLYDEQRSGLSGVLLALVQVAVTLIAALCSYWLLERPVRRGALGRRLGAGSWAVAPLATAAAVVAVLAATTVAPTAQPTDPRPVPVASATPPTAGDGRPVLDIVVLGDSVAHTLAGGTVGDSLDFEPWSAEQSPFDPEQARVWSVAKPACSFLPGRVTLDGGPGADLSPFCARWREDLDGTLAARPGATVVLALANDATDRRIGDDVIELGSPQHDALIGDLLEEIRTIVETGDGDLVILALPPRVGLAATPLDEGGRRDRILREALRAYVAVHPDVRLIDLFEVICPEGDCTDPQAGFDPDWRYDGLHYTRDGAAWVAGWLVDQLTS